MCLFSPPQDILFSFGAEDLISLNDAKNDIENDSDSALCPLISNDGIEHFKKPVSNNEKIANFHAKTDVCGHETFEVVDAKKTKLFDVPVYCNNRACDKSGCKDHRAYLFYKSHIAQEQCVTLSMRKPKTWIFTGYVLSLSEYDGDYIRKFARHQMSKLFRILKNQKYGSVTDFSIHMEFKFHPDGTVYLHFHVVTGGLKDFHRVRKEWGRVIVYEKAISPKAVAEYISKYASKTPSFLGSEFLQEFYHLLVYKTLMHRFSITRNEAEKNPNIISLVPSGCYSIPALLNEAKSAYMRDSYRNYKTDGMEYHPLLEPPLKPPEFTKSLFESKPDEINIRIHEEPDPNYKWESTEETRKQKPDFEIITESIFPHKQVKTSPDSETTAIATSSDKDWIIDTPSYEGSWKSKSPSRQKHHSSKLFKKYKMEIVPGPEPMPAVCSSMPAGGISEHGNCCVCNRSTYRKIDGKWLCSNCCSSR